MKQQKNNKTDFHKQLQAYSALGTAFLALAPQQAEADIVYVDVPDTQICVQAGPIDRNGPNTSAQSTRYVYLDLDGQDSSSSAFSGQDMYFTVSASAGVYSGTYNSQNFQIQSVGGAIGVEGYYGTDSRLMGIQTTFSNSIQPRNMPYGATISSAVTRASSTVIASIGFYSTGNGTSTANKAGDPAWLGSDFTDIQTTGYLGLEFPISGSNHYAWIQVTVENEVIMESGQDLFAKTCITILDYAYESCPNEPILAGHTSGGAITCDSGPASIPTLSEWGLLNLALLLMTFGTIYLIQPNFSLRKVARREEDK
ncbi:MAG: hypothetical protein R3E32_11305 [Chitinophagales bacterium]